MYLLSLLGAALAAPVLIAPPGMKTRVADPPRFDAAAAPGRCLVRARVDEQGVPAEVEARSCPPVYASAATEAVRGWRWEPVLADGAPAVADTLVAVAFTGRGRIAVPPAASCTYPLRILPDGAVRMEGDLAPQCAIWPPARVAAAAPAAGTCTVDVDPTAMHDDPAWLDASACPGIDALAAEIVAGSLYAPGQSSTRFVLVLPSAVARPESAVTTFAIPSPGADQAPTRLGGASGSASTDPGLSASTTAVPKVDLSALRDRAKPEPAPAPAPAP